MTHAITATKTVKYARRIFILLLASFNCVLQAQQLQLAAKNTRLEPEYSAGSDALSSQLQTRSNRQDFAGDTACRACHAEIADSYPRTAHHLTSRLPTSDSIAGPFAAGNNLLKTSNPELYFQMESKPDGFYETAQFSSAQGSSSRSERIDVVIGSGRFGQTYLYWSDNRLFQLPVSYWINPAGWINSPGYHDGTARFDRQVAPRCLECHATFAQSVPAGGVENRYARNSLELGISCERCHGPGSAHVNAMKLAKESEPSSDAHSGSDLINPAKLPHDRQIDVCAQCHSGRRQPLQPSFSYIPDQPLDRFLAAPDSSAKVDVHGNQVGLLKLSRCFQNSPQMTCATCHNVHLVQRDADSFSARCLQCHTQKACRLFPKFGDKIATGCVACHMPLQASNLTVTSSDGQQVRPLLRTHWIKVYPENQTP